jgi:CRP-like cAMP-binding protein
VAAPHAALRERVRRQIIPATMRALPVLQGLRDDAVLAELAASFTPREFGAGEVIAEAGTPIQQAFIVAHGRLQRPGTGKYGGTDILGTLTDGDQLGDEALGQADPLWLNTVKAVTSGTIMVLPWSRYEEIQNRSTALQEARSRSRTARRVRSSRCGPARTTRA